MLKMRVRNKTIVLTKKCLVVLLALVLFFGLVLPFGISSCVYYVNYRSYETKAPWNRTISEFPGLCVEKCSFMSNNGNRLAGYRYYRKDMKPKAVVIISHGLGISGQRIYMDTASYLTKHGYMVFAFDCTGVDESKGKSINGTQQGVIDLDHAIKYVEKDKMMSGYPLVLFGHSWGGYCVGAELNAHPKVKAVVAISGFDNSELYMREGLKRIHLGALGYYLPPYVTLEERIKFGKLSTYTASGGFAKTKARVMIIQSRDDSFVSPNAGYYYYYSKFKNNSRFVFKFYKNRGHMLIFYTAAARAYDAKYFREDYEGLTAYGKTHKFDSSKGFELDKAFYSGILAFLDSSCSK